MGEVIWPTVVIREMPDRRTLEAYLAGNFAGADRKVIFSTKEGRFIWIDPKPEKEEDDVDVREP